MAIPQAIVQDLEGEVSVTRNGEVVNIKSGDALLPGDVVETGGTGRLTLSFPGDGTQTPAEGVMTSNGKITLGEQTTDHGQQIVVLEDTECFEFTTEITEDSAAAEGSSAGLFGSEMGGIGALTAAGGAVAAGLFASGGGGGGDTSDASATIANPSVFTNTPLGDVDTSEADEPESPQEFADKNLSEESLQAEIIEPVQQAAEKSEGDPASSPNNVAEAGSIVATNIADIANDGLSATTGTGSPSGDIGEIVVDGINQSPLAEPLSPITQQVAQATSQELGLEQLDSLADSGLVTQLVQGVDSVADTTPLGEPLTPVTDGLSAVAQQVDTGIADGLTTIQDALGGLESGGGNPVDSVTSGLPTEGLVTQLAQTADCAIDTTPLGEPLTPVTDGLTTVAQQVDTGIAEGLTAIQDALGGGLESGGGNPLDAITAGLQGGDNPLDAVTSGLPTGDNPLAGALDGLQGGEAPDVGGLLGDASTLSSQMPDASDGGGGDLLGSVTSGIQSTAAEVQNNLPDGLDTGGLV